MMSARRRWTDLASSRLDVSPLFNEVVWIETLEHRRILRCDHGSSRASKGSAGWESLCGEIKSPTISSIVKASRFQRPCRRSIIKLYSMQWWVSSLHKAEFRPFSAQLKRIWLVFRYVFPHKLRWEEIFSNPEYRARAVNPQCLSRACRS